MKILVTGNRGFVGSETEKLLSSHLHQVIGYDIMDGYDIRDLQQLRTVVQAQQPDRILHLAAIARFSDADDATIKSDPLTIETNVDGTRHIAFVAKEFHKPVVYASTGSVYMPITNKPPITEKFPAVGNSQYGCTKRMGEIYIEKVTPHIILRYAHLYGKEKRAHGLIGGYVERIQRGLAPTLYGGKQSNDFTYIKDVAMANYLALTAPSDKWNQIYNVGTGEELTAEAAGETIIKIWNKHNPDKKFKGKVQKVTARTVDPERFVYDMTKARVMLGFNPEFTFEEGLDDMFRTEMVTHTANVAGGTVSSVPLAR